MAEVLGLPNQVKYLGVA